MNLYQILGIRRNASPETIRKAYRKKAMEHHPDRGGDREQFERVRLAHGVLSDPARRAKYDVTGEIEEPRPDNTNGPMLAILSQYLDGVLGQCLQQGVDPTHEDLVKHLRTAVKSRQGKVKEERKNLKKGQDCLTALRGRFSVKDGENYLEHLVEAQQAHLDKRGKMLDQEAEVLTRVLEFLERASFRHDQKVVMATARNGWAYTTASTTAW